MFLLAYSTARITQGGALVYTKIPQFPYTPATAIYPLRLSAKNGWQEPCHLACTPATCVSRFGLTNKKGDAAIPWKMLRLTSCLFLLENR